MKSIISRNYTSVQTTGKWITFDGDEKVLDLVTNELPDNGNIRNMSCIPEGTYVLRKIFSPTFGKCFKVDDVPDRSEILIHVGNYAAGAKKDTRGCILPGVYFEDINADGYLDVVESREALNKMLAMLPNESILIII